jgi:DNA adenine methylase
LKRTPLNHHGAKWNMAPDIIATFPEHRIYVEPFCGSCAVLLRKPRSFVEIINDKDDIIVNIFRTLRDHPLELAAKLWATPYAKRNWASPPNDDIERAAMEIAKTKQYYVGSQKTSTFSIDATAAAHRPKADVWGDWHERIIPAAARLKAVQILCEDGISVVNRFAADPDALIYIDPPYVGHEAEYRCAVDYPALVASCVGAKAKIVVSEFAEGETAWPSDWRRQTIVTTGRARTGKHGKAKKNLEYLIFNWNEPEPLVDEEGQ